MAATNNKVPPIGSNVITTDDVIAAGYDLVPLYQGGMLKVQEGTVDGDLTIKGDTAFNIEPLSLTTDLAAVSVAEGAALTLTVAVSGGLSPYTYQWYHNGAAIEGATEATYTKAEAEESDAGEYFARVKDSSDNVIVSKDAKVTVTEATTS